MTKRFPSLSSVRALAASRRRGHLSGTTWSTVVDRDVDRVTFDLLVLSQSAGATASSATRVARSTIEPVDLHESRGRGPRPTSPTHNRTVPHARAS